MDIPLSSLALVERHRFCVIPQMHQGVTEIALMPLLILLHAHQTFAENDCNPCSSSRKAQLPEC